MKKITISKEELLQILHDNKKIHVKEYHEMMTIYQVKAEAAIEELLKKVKKSAKGVMLHIHELPEPKSNEESYNLAIEMLSHEINTSVTITGDEYKNYVKDNWEWSRGFAASKSTYGV